MIERYSIATPIDQLARRFGIEASEAYRPVYNAAPSQLLPVITHTGPAGFSFFYWGLPPKWIKGKTIAEKTINLRAEAIAERPVLKKNLMKTRCLVPADGFYVWKKVGKKITIPWRFSFAKSVFAFAGIWEEYEEEDETFHTFQIITYPAPPALSGVTERLPLMLPGQNEKIWMNPSATEDELLVLLSNPTVPVMDNYSVSPELNSPDFNKPSLFLPVPPADQHGNLTLFD